MQEDAEPSGSRTFPRADILTAHVSDAVENIRDIFYTVDYDWRVTYANARAAATVGLSREELLGRTLWDFFPNVESSMSYRMHMKAAMERQPVFYEVPSPTLGAWVDVAIYPSDTGLCVYVRDIDERKRREEAVRKSEADFRALFELAAVGISQVDPSTKKFLRVNRKFLEMVGYTFGELCHMTFADMTHPDDVPRNVELFERAVRGQLLEFSMEKRLIRKDGAIIWVLVTGSMVRDDHGRPIRSISVIQDITEHRRAADTLRDTAERFRVTLQNTGVLAYQTDRERRYTWIENPHRDFDPAQVLGRRDEDLLPAAEAAPLIEAKQRVLASGRGENIEITVSRSNGLRTYALMIEPRCDGNGAVVGLTAAALDITDRKHTEEALKESEARFRAMADDSPINIWAVDAAGRMEFLNRTYADFLGCTSTEAIERQCGQMVHPEDWESYRTSITQATQTGQPFRVCVRERRGDGKWRWMEMRGKPRRDAEGRLIGFIGSSADMTEVYESQRALEVADRRKDEFLAILGHELRNPLAAISNALRILHMAHENPAAGAQALHIMERKVGHLARLVDDLLQVSRITRDEVDLRRGRVELGSILEEAVDTSRPLVEAAQHELSVTLPGEPLHLYADSTRLVQVFANLLNNAAKYTDANGRIVVTAWREDSTAVVSIRDTGIGIPGEMLTRVFDMFTQVDRSRAQGGVGIGLTLVRKLVELHGGSVKVHSDGPGKGSEFVVRLPLAF